MFPIGVESDRGREFEDAQNSMIFFRVGERNSALMLVFEMPRHVSNFEGSLRQDLGARTSSGEGNIRTSKSTKRAH